MNRYNTIIDYMIALDISNDNIADIIYHELNLKHGM